MMDQAHKYWDRFDWSNGASFHFIKDLIEKKEQKSKLDDQDRAKINFNENCKSLEIKKTIKSGQSWPVWINTQKVA